MARRAQEEDRNDGWKDTYGDMVTLLLCFFVLLYSMSSVNSEKWEAFVKAFANPGEDTAQVVLTPSPEKGDHMVPGNEMQDGAGGEPTDEPPQEFNQLFEYLKNYVEENNMSQSVELKDAGEVVYIRYQNSLFFRPDSAELTEEARPNLDFLGECLKTLEDQIWLISISGHTASVQVENYGVSDWKLSVERAGSVAQYFEDNFDIDPKRLLPLGHGKNHPIDTNETSEGREHNRRVELAIMSNESPIAESPELAQAIAGLFSAEPFESREDITLEQLLDPESYTDGQSSTSSPSSSSSAPDASSASSTSSTSEPDSGSGGTDSASQPEDASSATDEPGTADSGQDAGQDAGAQE